MKQEVKTNTRKEHTTKTTTLATAAEVENKKKIHTRVKEKRIERNEFGGTPATTWKGEKRDNGGDYNDSRAHEPNAKLSYT